MKDISHRPAEPSTSGGEPVPEQIQGEFQGSHWRAEMADGSLDTHAPHNQITQGEASAQVDSFFREHRIPQLSSSVVENSEGRLILTLNCGSFILGAWQEAGGEDWWKASPTGRDQFGSLGEMLPHLERQIGVLMGWYSPDLDA